MLPFVYAFFLVSSTAAGVLILLTAYKRRRSKGSREFMIMISALIIWSFCYALHWLSPHPQAKFFWINLTYIGVTIVPAAFLLFSLRITNNDRWVSSKTILFLSIEPILVNILLWSDPWTGWFFAGKRGITDSSFFDGSSLFWVNVIYSYSLLLISYIILVRFTLHQVTFFRWQTTLILASLTLPFVINIISVLKMVPWSNLDITPITFTITCLVLLYALISRHLFDLSPIAREMAFEGLEDGILVLDLNYRIVDFNPAALSLFPSSYQLAIGQLFDPQNTLYPEIAASFFPPHQLKMDLQISASPPLYIHLIIKGINDHQKQLIGYLISWRDITELKLAEELIKKANQELHQQLREVQLLQSELQEQDMRDSLTILHNRRYLNSLLPREFAQAQRLGIPLTAVLFDLDHFKQVNDTYGHQSGDLVIIQAANLLSRFIRQSDILCRYGGEEFLLIIINSTSTIAAERAEEWRKTFSQIEFIIPQGFILLTISIGIASYPQHAQNTDELLIKADAALYQAKNSGRNQVCIYSSI